MITKYINIANYEVLVIIKYKNVKNINFCFNSEGLVVSAPKNISADKIISLIQNNEKLYEQYLNKNSQKTKLIKKENDQLYKALLYGIYVNILINVDSSLSRKNTKLINHDIIINTPKFPDIKSIENTFLNYITKMELPKIQERVFHWMTIMSISLNDYKIVFRNTRSKWGSFSKQKNEICFSKKIFHLPSKCIDYIIVHELAHIFEYNHSKNFWKIVEQYFPIYKDIKRKMSYYII